MEPGSALRGSSPREPPLACLDNGGDVAPVRGSWGGLNGRPRASAPPAAATTTTTVSQPDLDTRFSTFRYVQNQGAFYIRCDKNIPGQH